MSAHDEAVSTATASLASNGNGSDDAPGTVASGNGALDIVGSRVREERLRQSVSQEQLALYADVDRTFVSQIERGIRQPTLTTLFKLSRVLKLAPSVLVARMERSIKR